MNLRRHLLVVFALATTFACRAVAQGYIMGRDTALLGNLSVQSELKMTPAQADRVKVLADRISRERQETFLKVVDADTEDLAETLRDWDRSPHSRIIKSLGTVLEPDQLARYKQL